MGGTDNFVSYYGLQKRNFSQMKLTVKIKGDYNNQLEIYYSNNSVLLKAVENQDSSIIKKVFA